MASVSPVLIDVVGDNSSAMELRGQLTNPFSQFLALA